MYIYIHIWCITVYVYNILYCTCIEYPVYIYIYILHIFTCIYTWYGTFLDTICSCIYHLCLWETAKRFPFKGPHWAVVWAVRPNWAAGHARLPERSTKESGANGHESGGIVAIQKATIWGTREICSWNQTKSILVYRNATGMA